MTLDDESSIYVGGLPYDITEETLRTAFDLYGAILDVKIINDQRTRGKCYGFVTYTNPRSAVDAIDDMNGRTIDGRIIKVNEVKTRGGRSSFGGERFHHNVERNGDWDRSRDRVRDYDHDKDGYRNHSDDRSRERDRSRDRDRDREQKRDRRYERIHDNDLARESSLDNKQSREGELVDNEWEHSRAYDQYMERGHSLDVETDKKMDRASKFDRSFDDYRNMQSKRKIDLNVSNQLSADLSSDSNGNHNDKLEDVERSVQRIDLLKNEISQMEETLDEKRYVLADLQKQSRKLEDALINAKKQTAYRQIQLTKLHKCFLQVKDCTERLESSEKELQAMVDAAALDIDGDGAGLKDGLLMNGIA